jgi:hypothetical protein
MLQVNPGMIEAIESVNSFPDLKVVWQFPSTSSSVGRALTYHLKIKEQHGVRKVHTDYRQVSASL